MSLDLEDSFEEIKGKIDSFNTYKEVKNDIKSLSRKVNDNTSKRESEVGKFIGGPINSNYEANKKSQFEKLLEMIRTNISGAQEKDSSIGFLKKLMVEAAINSKSQISKLIQSEMMKSLGCSEQEAYIPMEVIIPISSFDLLGTLKKSPESKAGKSYYERETNYTLASSPFPLNREFYNATQTTTPSYFNQNFSSPYIGYSQQPLFDITFDPIAHLPSPFNYNTPAFRVKVFQRNRMAISDFFGDYFRKISIFDNRNLLGQILETLTGSLSMELMYGLEERSKLMLIIERILGLCVDNNYEIDVSGIGKTPELDLIDENFFMLSEIDQRRIDKEISNIRNGTTEFIDCGNLEFKVNNSALLDYIENIIYVEQGDEARYIEELTDNIISSQGWDQFQFPDGIKLYLDIELIKSLPKAVILSILSPKVIFPFVLMSVVMGKTYIYNINNISDFIKDNIKLFKEIASKIGAIFIKELYKIIVKNIKFLVFSILEDLKSSAAKKQTKMILSLIEIALIVASAIHDYRRCKSLVDEILMLLSLATRRVSTGIPMPLLAMSGLRSGFSNTRAFTNVISEYQKLGLPTGPMPDGSPNMMLISKFAEIEGIQNEENVNGKVEVFLPPNGPFSLPLKLSGVKI